MRHARTPDGVAVRALVVGVALLLMAGCASPRRVSDAPATSTDVPGYATLVERYNARADRLERIWSRAVVQVRYTDEGGRRRSHQGEGHLQLVQPYNVALSIGKLGETLFWLGGDAERFWIFELGEMDRASVCRHDNVGSECAEPMSVPVHPLTLVELIGITPLDADAGGSVRLDETGERLVVEVPHSTGSRSLILDPETLLPARIELYDGDDSLVIWSDLDEYERIAMDGSPGFNPQIATRIHIDSSDGNAQVRVFLSDVSDGIAIGRIPDAAFDFETLARAHRPDHTIVLDEDCERPSVDTHTTRAAPK